MNSDQMETTSPPTPVDAAAGEWRDNGSPLACEQRPHTPLFPDIGVIALVPDHWGPYWQLRHQLLSRVARYFHVVWADLPPTWRHPLQSSRGRDSTPRPAALQVYTAPWFLPRIGRPGFLKKWTERARLHACRDMLLAQGCRRIVLYVWRPEFDDALDQIPHDLACYHIDDEYPYSSVERPIDPQQADLIRRVDHVFIHSLAMMRKKGALNPNSELLPNGVDYRRYATPVPEPADLAQVPHPRIGYTGNLKRMINWELLLQLGAKHRDWSFIFVGPRSRHAGLDEQLALLQQYPNMYFLGPKSVDSLPAYPQHFDVAIMPYCVDAYTNYIYPLKLHEYLASGRPVVGSAISTLQSFRDVVLIADTVDQWSNALISALTASQNTDEARLTRQLVARAHDWEILTQKVVGSLMKRLGGETEDQWNAWLQHSGSQISVEALSR